MYRHSLIKYLLTLCFLMFITSNIFGEEDERWRYARKLTEEGRFKEATTLYRGLNKERDSIYNMLYEYQTDDLSEVFKVDEIELNNQKTLNSYLSMFYYIMISMILIFITGAYYLKKTAKKLIISNNKLQQAYIKADQAKRSKTIFLSNMSHEIRTPLNAIVGFSSLLTSEDLDNDTKKQSQEIIDLNSNLLTKIFNDVAFTQNNNLNDIDFNITSYDVIQLCAQVLETIEKIKTGNSVFKLECPETQYFINTDSARLQQVLTNLLVNADKFTKSGTITLTVSFTTKEIIFSVTDTGCGITKENQKRLFKRFEKFDEEKQGTGLGLSISRMIIERLGGKISYDSTYTEGARFVFTHPI